MLLSFAFYVNSLGNFLLQIVLGHLLSPAEYGWYATVSLAALSLAGATLDWLRVAALRYSDPTVSDERVGSVLELGYLSVVVLIYLAAAAAFLLHWTFGLTPTLLILTPLLAVGFNRVDFLGARLRARRLDREFSLLFGLRQALYFTLVVAAAWLRRDAAAVIAGMAFASFASAALVGRVLRAPLARFGHEARQNLMRFFAYGQPVVVSLMLYQLIYLVNRSFALNTLGASAAGELSLATDIGSRLFMAVNTLPEFLLFQLVLTEHRERGVSAATRQLEDNAALAFALMAGLAAGYMAMADTFASLVAPSAYRGDFSGLTRMLTPGFMAFCLITAAINPVFQLAQRTLPVALAGVAALAVDSAGLKFTDMGGSLQGLAKLTSISFLVGLGAAIAIALVTSPARPRLRDCAIVVLAASAMWLGLRELDALPSHILAAALALVLGGGFYAGVLVAFDVGAMRSRLIGALRALRRPGLGVAAE